MYRKLLAVLPAILATGALAQPIYFTANDHAHTSAAQVGKASAAVTAGNPGHDFGPEEPIYFTANRQFARDTQLGKASGAAAADAKAAVSSGLQGPIYFTANRQFGRFGATQVRK